MPRLRLLCCSLVTTEVGEYEGGIYDRHVCDRECGGCFTAHLCDVVALLRGGRATGGNRHDPDLTARLRGALDGRDRSAATRRGSGGALVARSPHRAVDARSWPHPRRTAWPRRTWTSSQGRPSVH